MFKTTARWEPARRARPASLVVSLAGTLLSASMARAGGGAENALLIIDPTSPVSLHLGNYYKSVRNIPDANVLYLDPDAVNYPAFVATQLPGFLGNLAQRRIEDHIDFVVVTPGNSFAIQAQGLVGSSGCPAAVGNFSISSVFTMARVVGDIIPGPISENNPNRYFNVSQTQPVAFDSNTSYLAGLPNTTAGARRYFIGALLGYDGPNGNTPTEIRAMIDRSVAADGTRPAGTFYFMNNLADPVRNSRACGAPSCAGVPTVFNSTTNYINTVLMSPGHSGMTINGVIPTGHQDILGVVAGFESADVLNADLTILPGAYCDHLTSYAAAFGGSEQTKASVWITRGASGTAGTVEEPCNFPGKFTHANMHVIYLHGLTLGEAYLRSLAFTPFQQLLLGDPLTRPFAHIPAVTVPNAPGGTVSGTIQLTPQATTSHPSALITSFELLIDGVLHSTTGPGGSFTVKTTQLADGRHDLRVRAYDSTLVKSVGRWVGTLDVNNFGRISTLSCPQTTGNLTDLFTFNLGASGGTVREIRLLQNGRVVAARLTAGSRQIFGRTLGAGPVTVVAQTEFTDGRYAYSPPVTLNIAATADTPLNAAPLSFSYTKEILRGSAAVVELPGSADVDFGQLTYTVVTPPAQATVAGSGAWRVLTPNANACGSDSMTFRVASSGGQSLLAQVTLRYVLPPVSCRPDFNNDGQLTVGDFGAFQTAFVLGEPRSDMNDDCQLTVADFGAFQTAFVAGCP